jgi:hypothetical protein
MPAIVTRGALYRFVRPGVSPLDRAQALAEMITAIESGLATGPLVAR